VQGFRRGLREPGSFRDAVCGRPYAVAVAFAARRAAAASTRTANGSVFINTFYKITENATVAAEVSNRYTQYKRMDSGNSVRFQIAFIYGM
jgi:hypothetical protein